MFSTCGLLKCSCWKKIEAMKKLILTSVLSILTATIFAAAADSPAIIPAPQQMERHPGAFQLKPSTRICVDAASRDTGEWLAAQLRKSTGYPFEISADTVDADCILLTQSDAKSSLGAEGYDLSVTTNSAVVRAPQSAGVFYGAETLLQLLPPEIFSSVTVSNTAWKVPDVEIEDQPRFKWRGVLLDVSRHFFTKDEIKRFLDEMALHKLNTFHWHLVDDQGWRIEIKKYPRLTEIGAWRKESAVAAPKPGHLHPAWADATAGAYDKDGRYGGFYTQDDIREVVAYAAARHITIVPEIEMPGHSTAALAAYPQFSCTGGPFSTDVKAGVNHGIYCAGNDATYEFLQNVLEEVFQLFPGKYIHIGGDEVPIEEWQHCPKDQALIKREGLKDAGQIESYFIRRMEKFINAHNRTLIGWSEIRQGGLAQSAVVMDWIGGGVEAAAAGHDVVMTPSRDCYLDHYQSADQAIEPRAIGGYQPLNKTYAYEPIPTNMPPEAVPHVLGAQGNIWTEYIASFQHVEYMAFPRMCALAEVTWSPKASRDWDDFMRRMEIHARRLEELGINYRRGAITEPERNPFK
jgi:hexosaminidase